MAARACVWPAVERLTGYPAAWRLLCALLYHLLITTLQHLRGEQLSVRMASQISTRQDELGELDCAFDHMAERLQGMLSLQRQLLRDLSHGLRTPLSRLRVACESGLDAEPLRQRLERHYKQVWGRLPTLLQRRVLRGSGWLPAYGVVRKPGVGRWGRLAGSACRR